MPAFAVITLDAFGQRRVGYHDAADLASLRARLRAEAVWVVNVLPVRPKRHQARLTLARRDLIALLHQWELQVRAGVTADAALAQLATDLPAGSARTMVTHIHGQVAQGVPIHVACRTFPRVFPPEIAAVIAAGETSAQLPEALRALAEHLASTDELQRTARRALIYPAVVLVATLGLIGFLLGAVVPRFAEIFASLQVALPPLTVVLIRLSDTLRHGGPVGLVLAALTGAALWTAWHAPRLRYRRDRVLLTFPFLGETLRCLGTARFAAHTRLMHEAGLPLLTALATGAELTGNAVLARDLVHAGAGVAAGQSLCAALPATHSFPGFVVPVLRAGETTGQLGTALRHIEHYAASRAREQVATALACLEPAVLTLLTAVVGVIALSFFLPLFALLGGVSAR